MSHIKSLKLRIDDIKRAIESYGGGKTGISMFLWNLYHALEPMRYNSSMVQNSDENFDRVFNFDNDVRRFGIGVVSYKILDMIESLIASIGTPLPSSFSCHGSRLDGNDKGKQHDQGIHPHEFQSQGAYPSSVMLRDGQVSGIHKSSWFDTKAAKRGRGGPPVLLQRLQPCKRAKQSQNCKRVSHSINETKVC